ATTPFVVCVIPVVYAISAVLMSASSSLATSTMEVVTMLLSLIPVFNPVYTIFFVKAYRHALLRCLGLLVPIKRPSGVHPSRTSAGFDLSVAPSIF
ncbi:hypothetical protein AAVH_39217, partial [Aphelenchoides avenae]